MKKNILIVSILCLICITTSYTYSAFKNIIKGNITATTNNWKFSVSVTGGVKENDYYKVPINSTSGSFNINLDTTGNSKNVEYSIEFSGLDNVIYYTDSSYSNVIENNIYKGIIEKNKTNTLTIYYKSIGETNGNIYIKVKGIISKIYLYDYIINQPNNGVDTSIDFSLASFDVEEDTGENVFYIDNKENNIKSLYYDAGGIFGEEKTKNGNGINIVSGTETNPYPIHYYRGQVYNNNVIYANFCWKILRTTETGGVKLVYNGVPADGKCTEKYASVEETVKFNESNASPIYAGYMHGLTAYTGVQLSEYQTHLSDISIIDSSNTTTETIGNKTFNIAGRHVQNAKSSTLKIAVDTWYQNNLLDTTYENMLEDTVFCNDRSTSTGNSSLENVVAGTKTSFHYTGFDRLDSVKPSLVCQREMDRFTVNSSNGNGDLEYPVGLLTADEIIYAGYRSRSLGLNSWITDSFLFSSGSSNVNWTITPSYYDSSDGTNINGVQDSIDMYFYANKEGVLFRPVISLKNEIYITGSGDGTSDNPIEVTI